MVFWKKALPLYTLENLHYCYIIVQQHPAICHFSWHGFEAPALISCSHEAPHHYLAFPSFTLDLLKWSGQVWDESEMWNSNCPERGSKNTHSERSVWFFQSHSWRDWGLLRCDLWSQLLKTLYLLLVTELMPLLLPFDPPCHTYCLSALKLSAFFPASIPVYYTHAYEEKSFVICLIIFTLFRNLALGDSWIFMYVPHIITSRLKSTINWIEEISLSAGQWRSMP